VAIPVFYLPALFYGPQNNFAVIDNWRFWIIHLWVEGSFELFATVLVAIMFHQMGVVSTKAAKRLIYLDAILYLSGGIIGTGHHWYFTGQGTLNMGLPGVTKDVMNSPENLWMKGLTKERIQQQSEYYKKRHNQ
jgi:nitric oxide reductase subunit B